MRRRDFVALAASFLAVPPRLARAEEIRFLCASALRPAMSQLIAAFQKATGHTISVTYANIGTITDQIRNGAHVGLGVISAQQWASLQADGKVRSDVKVQFAQVGLGVAVRPGGPQVDLSSADAVKRTLLNARAVAFGDPAQGSPSGADTLRLFENLGIGAEMKPKSVVLPGSAEIIQAIVDRQADFGIIHTSVIAAAAPKVLLAALPPDLRYVTIFVASIPVATDRPEVAKEFSSFLLSRDAVGVLHAQGMDLN
jgi:molybdate transport system substrate-binding protein